MPQLIIIILLAALGIWLAVMAVWIVFVLGARIIGFVLGIVIIVGGLAFLAGIIAGLVIPYRVLHGKSEAKPVVVWPADVAQGKVFRSRPSGAGTNFDWDYAWPNYVPFQLRHDQSAVVRQCWQWTTMIAVLNFGWWAVFTLIPTLGLILGLWCGTALWYALTWLFRTVVVAVQAVTMRMMRAKEKRFMKKSGATVHCVKPGCYASTTMPSFRCASCATVHRDMAPGRLGIRTRVCGCGAFLPLTVARASQELDALCPVCDSDLPRGSGTRRVIRVPVFGPVAAGKTQFLATSAATLNDQGDEVSPGLSITALSTVAGQFLTTSVNELRAGQGPAKTAHDNKPEGYPFLIERPGGALEMHLIDAAGENFVTAEHSRALTYLDDAAAYVFLLDPLSIPEVSDRLHRSPLQGQIPVAQGDADDAYGSVIDQLVELDSRHIAVVVTKADIVSQISDGEHLPGDSAGIRGWLLDVGADRLIARIESDFRNVTYFAVDSTSRGRPDEPQHPLRVIDWALTVQGADSLYSASEEASHVPQQQNQEQTA